MYSRLYQIELTPNANFLQRPRNGWPDLAQVLLCKQDGKADNACNTSPTSRALQLPKCTSIFWEQNCKRALFQDARWVVLLGKLGNCPMINAFMIPWLLFSMLHDTRADMNSGQDNLLTLLQQSGYTFTFGLAICAELHLLFGFGGSLLGRLRWFRLLVGSHVLL